MKILALLFLVSGCTNVQAKGNGSPSLMYVCSKSGVEYVMRGGVGGIALHVDPDGKPVRCK